MRAIQAGILLILALSSAVFGQATGFVEDIGFDRVYRSECWTPMLVNLTSQLGEPAEYDIRVEQEDLDGDTVVFSRRVTLNAGAQDKYWVYFLPRSTPNSLPSGQADLQRALKVNLFTPGGKHVANLPLTTPAENIEDAGSFGGGSFRGVKLVLVVMSQEGRLPGARDYERALGLIEGVQFVLRSTADLPENVLGYDAVDAVLWLNADAADLSRGGSRKQQALEQYVRQGGQLVVSHPTDRSRIEAFVPLLPVELKRGDEWLVQIRDREAPEPLHTLAEQSGRLPVDNWHRLKGPFPVARAAAKPGAVVEHPVEWTRAEAGGKANDVTPYIARIGVGMGSVTWVAQDLSSPAINTRGIYGWAHVWDRVFGWKNETHTAEYLESKLASDNPAVKRQGEIAQDRYRPGNVADLGKSVLDGTDHTGKAAAYILLAILFFIGYWVIAGPGSYVFLAGKGKRHLSWGIFALSALAATLLTVGVVKLVLRGDPEVRHFTIVRQMPGEETISFSRIGLYIPRDGMQTVALPGVAPDAVSTIHALTPNSRHLGTREGFRDTGRYTIPVRDDNSAGGMVKVDFPYRSTLKKIQVQRVGPITANIAGAVSIVPSSSHRDPVTGDNIREGYIQGRLVNQTGYNLVNVFVAFRYNAQQDQMLFVPRWPKGTVLDLEPTFNKAQSVIATDKVDFSTTYSGPLRLWGRLFHKRLESRVGSLSVGGSELSDYQAIRTYLAMMSIFNRIAPQQNELGLNSSRSRVEIIRREGRELDLSPALAAGRVIVLAEAHATPLPFPLEVEGDEITGEGETYFQFVLPADRSKMPLYDIEEPESAEGPAEGDETQEDGTEEPPYEVEQSVEQ